MKIGVRLFLSSMVFAIAIATIYGFTTHDVVGIVFLGAMALALIVVAGFIVVAEREANLAGDRDSFSPSEAAGEEMGVFTLESYWPVIAAAGSAILVLGVVFLPGVSVGAALLGAALIAWTLRFMVREST